MVTLVYMFFEQNEGAWNCTRCWKGFIWTALWNVRSGLFPFRWGLHYWQSNKLLQTLNDFMLVIYIIKANSSSAISMYCFGWLREIIWQFSNSTFFILSISCRAKRLQCIQVSSLWACGRGTCISRETSNWKSRRHQKNWKGKVTLVARVKNKNHDCLTVKIDIVVQQSIIYLYKRFWIIFSVFFFLETEGWQA